MVSLTCSKRPPKHLREGVVFPVSLPAIGELGEDEAVSPTAVDSLRAFADASCRRGGLSTPVQSVCFTGMPKES